MQQQKYLLRSPIYRVLSKYFNKKEFFMKNGFDVV
jgi:hypothetical protein